MSVPGAQPGAASSAPADPSAANAAANAVAPGAYMPGGMGYGYGYGSFYGPGGYGGLGSGMYSGYTGLMSRFGAYNGMGGYGNGALAPDGTAAGAAGVLQSVMAPGQSAMASLQHLMHTVARFTGILEENMRNVHIIFDSVFGLVYNLGFLREELRSVFTGVQPKSWLMQLLRKILGVWRVALLVALSPLIGRFSPVAWLLKALGLAPSPVAEANGEAGPSADQALEDGEDDDDEIHVRDEEQGDTGRPAPSRRRSDAERTFL